jgi:hypothetical protein
MLEIERPQGLIAARTAAIPAAGVFPHGIVAAVTDHDRR